MPPGLSQAAALNLDGICRTAGPQGAMKRIVPTFLKLCADDIWGVRKACAESLISVSKSLELRLALRGRTSDVHSIKRPWP